MTSINNRNDANERKNLFANYFPLSFFSSNPWMEVQTRVRCKIANILEIFPRISTASNWLIIRYIILGILLSSFPWNLVLKEKIIIPVANLFENYQESKTLFENLFPVLSFYRKISKIFCKKKFHSSTRKISKESKNLWISQDRSRKIPKRSLKILSSLRSSHHRVWKFTITSNFKSTI